MLLYINVFFPSPTNEAFPLIALALLVVFNGFSVLASFLKTWPRLLPDVVAPTTFCMAKGRKLTFSLSDSYLGSYNNSYDNGANGTAGSDASELREEEVWSTIDDGRRSWIPREGSSIARRGRSVGGLSLAFDDPRVVHQFWGVTEGSESSPREGKTACSVPVMVPDWSKIYRVESMHGSDEEEREEEQEMLPPHEYLARTRKIAAESVFEGVGRTLKGREMRRVRDAVWSRTGFDG